MKKIITFALLLTTILSGCTNPSISEDNSNDSQPETSVSLSEDSSDNSADPVSSEDLASSETIPPSSEDGGNTSEITPPNNYYTNIDGSTFGVPLQNSLRTLITSTHKVLTTYDGLASVFKQSDADPTKSGNIIWFYSGTSVKFSGFGGSVGATNREHVWPKDGGSAFSEKSRAGSDAHHLRPTETQLNSIRGSKSFGEVAQTSSNIAKQNNSTTYASGDYLSYKDSTYFYPGKGFRGQTARILFYVQLRWGSEYQLKFVLGAGHSKTIGDIETLMKWHLEEPVSDLEKTRNEVVYGIQGNRNPFIDEPAYACRIYAHDGQSYNSKLQNVCNV